VGGTGGRWGGRGPTCAAVAVRSVRGAGDHGTLAQGHGGNGLVPALDDLALACVRVEVRVRVSIG